MKNAGLSLKPRRDAGFEARAGTGGVGGDLAAEGVDVVVVRPVVRQIVDVEVERVAEIRPRESDREGQVANLSPAEESRRASNPASAKTGVRWLND